MANDPPPRARRSRSTAHSLSLSLLPTTALPSLLHSRAPLLLSPSPTSSSGSRRAPVRCPTNEDWWRWRAPTVQDVILRGHVKAGARMVEENVGGRKETRKDGKMVGEWRVGEVLGEGSSGRVRLARNTVTGVYAAVKMVKKLPVGHKHAAAVDREIIVSKLVEHRYLLKLYDVYESPSHIFLISEYCELGELYKFVMTGRLLPEMTRRFFYQIVSALSHLHRMSICHRDIKLENLLVVEDEDGELCIKLADLGMAAHSSDLMSTSCGSPHYAAPEIIRGDAYDGCTADIWSLGVTLFALISGQLPFHDDSVPTVLAQIKRGKYKMHELIQNEERDLIARMLVVDVAKRISISHVREHPYLLLGHFEPIESTMPYPLQQQHFENRIEDRIDKVVLQNLKVLCKGEKEETILEAIYSPEVTKARVFYLILDNFRTRVYISDIDKMVRMSLPPPVAAAPSTRSHRKPRRSISVPALSLAITPSQLDLPSTTSSTQSPLIEVEHASPEEYRWGDDEDVSALEPNLPSFFIDQIDFDQSEIIPSDSSLPATTRSTFFLPDTDSHLACASTQSSHGTSTIGRSDRGSKAKAFSQKIKGLFQKGSLAVANGSGAAAESSSLFQQSVSDSLSTGPSMAIRTSFLKRSIGYNSLHRVPLLSLSPLASPTFPLTPSPTSPLSPTRVLPSPSPARMPLSSLTNSPPSSATTTAPSKFGSPRRIHPAVFFHGESTPSATLSIKENRMHSDSPPSPSPLKRRPSPLCLTSTVKHPSVPRLATCASPSSSSCVLFNSPLLTSIPTATTTSSTLTPANSLFIWSPHARSSSSALSPHSMLYHSMTPEGEGATSEIERLESMLRGREEELEKMKIANEELRRRLDGKEQIIDTLRI